MPEMTDDPLCTTGPAMRKRPQRAATPSRTTESSRRASAVEEVLRWTSPVTSFLRTAVADAELAGTPIAAGDPLLLIYAAANRDEAEFGPSASTFDVGRTPNHHVALGHGPHFCLGAFLGRAELSGLLSCLRDMVGGIEVTGTPRRIYSNFLFGYSSLPVVFRPR